jgi:hypothetical protein
MNCKRKGTRNEHRSAEILEAAGYRVTRSGASLGAWDLVGISATGFIVCQVKSTAWPGSVEMEILTLFPVPPNCQKIVHRWRPRARTPDVREL